MSSDMAFVLLNMKNLYIVYDLQCFCKGWLTKF